MSDIRNNFKNQSVFVNSNSNKNNENPVIEGSLNKKQIKTSQGNKNFFARMFCGCCFGGGKDKGIDDRNIIATACDARMHRSASMHSNSSAHIYMNVPKNSPESTATSSSEKNSDICPLDYKLNGYENGSNASLKSTDNHESIEDAILNRFGSAAGLVSLHSYEELGCTSKESDPQFSGNHNPDETTTSKSADQTSPRIFKAAIDDTLATDNNSLEIADEDLYVNMSVVNNQVESRISKSSREIIMQAIQVVKDSLPKRRQKNKATSDSTYNMFYNEIEVEARTFTNQEIIKADRKYRDIHCPRHSAATKGNIYHANKIDLKYGSYIAAQGPYTKNLKPHKKVSNNTADNFIAMLAENQSPISVSFVNQDEFVDDPKNDKIPPRYIGEIYKIPEKIVNDKVVREKTVIEKLDEIIYDNIGLQIDTFAINDKIHMRVYDLIWEDHTAGNPQRLLAIALFIEKLRQLPELAATKDNRIVINCNAGVGRTGTYMMVHDAVLQYQQEATIPSTEDIKQNILQARANRSAIVQTCGQLETVKTAINLIPENTEVKN